MLYGKQRKHFPTRAIKENKHLQTEINKVKESIMTEAEYTAIIQKPQKILIFQGDEETLQGLSLFNAG